VDDGTEVENGTDPLDAEDDYPETGTPSLDDTGVDVSAFRGGGGCTCGGGAPTGGLLLVLMAAALRRRSGR